MQAKAVRPVSLALALLVLVAALAATNAASLVNPPDTNYDDLLKILSLGYQVDVFVTGSHVAKHASSGAAMRCLNNKGNVAAFSEFGSWRLHLLCWEDETLFDVIVRRINRHVDRWENPNTELVTAYAPEGTHVAETTMQGQVDSYLQHLIDTVGGRIVRLRFNPGEIMFIPK